MRSDAARLIRAGLSGKTVLIGVLCALEVPTGQAVAGASNERVARVARAEAASIELRDFDIPAQPLSVALNRYADTSGQPALFPSHIVDGRTSTAVQGRYSPEAALHILLRGTGLTADKRNSGLGQTFILKEVGTPSSASRNAMEALFDEEGFAGLVQARVWQALCADTLTRPGSYVSLLRFHLDTDGRIREARLIGTSGDAGRDAALLDALRRVHIERSPPAAIAQQPLTMLVAPNDPRTGPQCAPSQ
jgi:hypothetical protein